MNHRQLLDFVKKKLKVRWTPEDIANRLPILHPDDPKMRVSAPTIYAWVERDRQQGGAYYTYLRLNQGRKYRCRRGLKGQKKRAELGSAEEQPNKG